MDKEAVKNKLAKISLEKGVTLIAVVFLVCIALYSAFSIAGVLPNGFSSDVFLSPFRMIMAIPKLKMAGLLLTPLSIILIILGIKNSKSWYLLPTGIFILAMYWFVTNLLVINLIKKTVQ